MQPTDIRVQKTKKQVRIRWENGEEKLYSFSTLRSHCPCADCEVDREKPSDLPDGQIALQIPLKPADWDELVRVELVGNYALRIYWKDGHHQGIYSWDTLYDLPSRMEPQEEK